MLNGRQIHVDHITLNTKNNFFKCTWFVRGRMIDELFGKVGSVIQDHSSNPSHIRLSYNQNEHFFYREMKDVPLPCLTATSSALIQSGSLEVSRNGPLYYLVSIEAPRL